MGILFKKNGLPTFFVTLAAALGLSVVPVSAQNTQLMGSGLMEKFSASDVATMLGEFQIQTALAPYANDETATVLATTAGGGQFFLTMFDCDNPAAGVGCEQAFVFTGMPNAGVASEDLNTFNVNSNLAVMVNVAEQQLVIFGAPIFAKGGIGRTNFQLLVAIYLNDLQAYADSRASAATNVSMNLILEPGGKVANFGGDDRGRTRSVPVFDAATVDNAVSAAISNTVKVQFANDAVKQAVK